MNFIYIITIILLVGFSISFYTEPRRFMNAFLLIFLLAFLYLSLVTFSYDKEISILYSLILLAGFVGLPFLIFLSGIFLIINGIILLKKEGKSKTNLLSFFLGFLIIAFFGIVFFDMRLAYYMYQNRGIIGEKNLWYKAYTTLYYFIIYSYLVFGFSFGGFLLYSILYHFIPKRRNYDFIIIHGAGLLGGEEPTPLLKGRINRAIKAFKKSKNKDTLLIASGGQGPDEKISEAEAIKRYLLSQGIEEDKILVEDRSKTTYENLLYSKSIGEERKEKPTFLFVTNDYHVFRTSVYARRIGMKGEGLGCKTASYYLPSAFIREFIAIVVRLKWFYLAPYLLFLLFTLASWV